MEVKVGVKVDITPPFTFLPFYPFKAIVLHEVHYFLFLLPFITPFFTPYYI
jgi:hypothetical protein